VFTPPLNCEDGTRGGGLGVGGEVGLRDFNGGNRGKGGSYYLRVTHVRVAGVVRLLCASYHLHSAKMMPRLTTRCNVQS